MATRRPVKSSLTPLLDKWEGGTYQFGMRLLEHKYPKQIKILDDPYLTHLSAILSTRGCVQPIFNLMIRRVFQQLCVQILNEEWPVHEFKQPTRMSDLHQNLIMNTKALDFKQRGVCIDIARAGMVPSQSFMDELNLVMNPRALRQDHVFASRITNKEGQVTHTHLADSKIGGDIEGAIVMIPDPMGATGNSICEVISHYKEKVGGKAKKYIAAHMIITPEYVKKVTETHPDLIVYTTRLDRGFSTDAALKEIPGTLWDQEKGLDDNQYIVPGAGGVGELINNAFV